MITIGVVNNMPDAALQTTERQFRELLSAASEGRAFRLKFFSLPDVPRSESARTYISEHYADLSELWEGPIDGLIVTGAEPRTASLSGESYWPALTKLIDWAEGHTSSAIWSCLAAHAAVLHLDGVERRRFPEKLSGVFECAKTEEHPLVAAMPTRWRLPHSRYNTLDQESLEATGYHVLSASPDAGPDLFVKEGASLFVFLQGHPEYDAGALLREYQRDIGRFLAGTAERYPGMPRGCFDDATATALDAFRQLALLNRDSALLRDFPAAETAAALRHAWRDAAVRLYSNWMSRLVDQHAALLGRTTSRNAATVPPR